MIFNDYANINKYLLKNNKYFKISEYFEALKEINICL